MTHTYALLEVSAAAYDEIAAKLCEAGYSHAVNDDGEIDMRGLALTKPAPSLTGIGFEGDVTGIDGMRRGPPL